MERSVDKKRQKKRHCAKKKPQVPSHLNSPSRRINRRHRKYNPKDTPESTAIATSPAKKRTTEGANVRSSLSPMDKNNPAIPPVVTTIVAKVMNSLELKEISSFISSISAIFPFFQLSRAINSAKIWWVWEDLNFRPHPYQGCALTN